jgi:hypothetical protein
MQATGTLHEARLSKGFVLVVIAMLCALLLGAAGGYAARTVGQASAGAAVTQHVNAGPALLDRGADRGGVASQGGPQSDLTRALTTAAPDTVNVPDHGFIP